MRRALEEPVELNEEQMKFFLAMHDKFGELIFNLLSLEAAPADAEDMLQDVFISLAKNIKRVIKYDHPEAWLKRTAINRLKHYYRTRTRRREEVSLDELVTEPAIYDDPEFETVEEIPPVLTSEEMTMWDLQMNGYTEKEIAEKMKINYGSCRVRFSRIRIKLRKWWNSR